ncbi:MAG: tetratricopeptide repeat protein, partial [Planctomycetota bacterium]
MRRVCRGLRATIVAALLCMAFWQWAADPATATEVLLKDGRILKGRLGLWDSLAENPKGGDAAGQIRRIISINDDLRRTFVPERQVQQRLADQGRPPEKFVVWQKVLRGGSPVSSVGPRIRGLPYDHFDEHGRRTFRFGTLRGRVDVVQGITLITPLWTKVEALKRYTWDMRIATRSIPREILDKILLKEIDPKNIEERKTLARFYIDSERYKDARNALEAILKDFPDDPEVEKQLAPTIRSLRQMEAQQALRELRARREAGQHGLVLKLLEVFPSEGVAGEVLQEVREMSQEYDKLRDRVREVLEQFDAELAKIKDTAIKAQIEPIRKEIEAELNIDTLGRMAAFRQVVDDPQLSPSQKLSFAISGWLMGSDAAQEKLSVALSLYRVRRLVRQYLNEPIKVNRRRILVSMRSEERGPAWVAAMLAHMKPPVDPPPPVSAEKPGFYKLEIPGLAQRTPVVTLHAAGTTASQQIDWWAGGWTAGGWRAGQGARHGYIVIAPQWTTEHQKQYGYSAREHTAVLSSLRDACRRFAVDTDRVFLSGHSMGGDAAWDIGLAHPDLWAGVIPIVARSGRYCNYYSQNAKRLPFYVVCGELDGDRLTKNALDLDRYLQRGYNCTVVEYLGRGHEHFYEEILRIFDWMGRVRRDFFPREFECSTMR